MAVQEVDITTKSKLDFKDIIFLQVQNVVKSASVEFRGGFYTTTVTGQGVEKEIYVPDTREVFSNSVLALCILLKPRFTPEMEEEFTNYKKDIKRITDEFINASSTNETTVLGEVFYTNEKDKILLDEFKTKKLMIHMRLFKTISHDLALKNYFEHITANF